MAAYFHLSPRILALSTALCACTPDPESTSASTGSTTAGTGSTSETADTGASTTGSTTTPTTTGATGTASQTTDGTDDTGLTSDTSDTGTTANTDDTDDTGDTGDTDTGESSLCEGTGKSTLPGVSIVIPPQKCVFTLAEAMAGITFQYAVEVAEPITEVTPLPNDGGNCEQQGASGLIVSSDLDGDGQHYCLCDQGLCPFPNDPPIDLVPGSFPDTFDWNGVNWNGPSDTNNPFGPPFPPGDYSLNIHATGKFGPDAADFAVTGTLAVTLVP